MESRRCLPKFVSAKGCQVSRHRSLEHGPNSACNKCPRKGPKLVSTVSLFHPLSFLDAALILRYALDYTLGKRIDTVHFVLSELTGNWDMWTETGMPKMALR